MNFCMSVGLIGIGVWREFNLWCNSIIHVIYLVLPLEGEEQLRGGYEGMKEYNYNWLSNTAKENQTKQKKMSKHFSAVNMKAKLRQPNSALILQ